MCSKNVTKVERFCYNFSSTFANDIFKVSVLQNCYKNGDYFVTILIMQSVMFLSSKIVTVSPKNQAERFCQGVRPLLNE